MHKITISIDDETMAIVDRLAKKFSLDRSSVLRAIVRMMGPYLKMEAAYGIQAEGGEDTERS